MNVQWTSVRFYEKAIHLWVLGFLLSALYSAEWLWLYPISPPLPVPGKLGWVTHFLSAKGSEGSVYLAVVLLVILSLYNLFRPFRWWSALVVWLCYTNLMDRAWMAGSGGQQLVANVLFWNIFLSLGRENALHELASTSAFWMIRIQLILAYFVTGIYKLTGTSWLDGTAVGIAVSDSAFGPAWLADFSMITVLLTWSVLALQFLLPIAVWFCRTRVPILIIGAIFHIATALFMGIPEMAFAFIAVYAIWLSNDESERVKGAMTLRRIAF
ncbi:MAG: hypothetical protein IPF95_17215 [Flavobacteriales bacterium]|nr:hypothetical protein [Flavobacteriales bacterium]MBP9139115.1 hypothetical protein [Flavobacteriales bacterium]HQX31743.1 hypothetical protein [Flavobacteriales bacterium]HQZ92205.1 hypothetical protein [Flavobacteriales bacterium]